MHGFPGREAVEVGLVWDGMGGGGEGRVVDEWE